MARCDKVRRIDTPFSWIFMGVSLDVSILTES
jgi:hypothetical protein